MSGMGLNKSKRVSWASDVDLCQFRLFLLEDSPAQVSFGAQDHLQAKASLLLHSTRVGPAETFPPGFEGSQSHPSHQMQLDMSQISVIKWTPPPRVLLNLAWQVVSGEESNEVDVQYQRELRVFEAIYPRLSAIPPNAFVSSDIDTCCTDDDQAPFIPITSIEEDASASTLSDTLAASDMPKNSHPFLSSPGKAYLPPSSGPSISNVKFSHEPDIAAAVSTAFSAIMKNNEQGNLIDHELLTQILSNPQLIEKLLPGYETAPNILNTHNPRSLQMAISDSSLPINEDTSTSSSFASSAGDVYPQSLGIGVRPMANKQVLPHINVPVSILPSASVAPSPPIKDLSYYKSLIQQHGEERHENIPHFTSHHVQNPRGNHEMMQIPILKDSKPKILKPCIFFKSPRGCRNGANCAYQHDEASNGRGNAMPDAQGGKRMKLDREISS